MDPELLQQIVDVFAVELEEQLQTITDSILKLEKTSDEAARLTELDMIFRAAHNIKGAARAVDANHVADIAHQLESLFSRFKQVNAMPPAEPIDLCLQSLDSIKICMAAYVDGQDPDVDLDTLYRRLQQAVAGQRIEQAVSSEEKSINRADKPVPASGEAAADSNPEATSAAQPSGQSPESASSGDHFTQAAATIQSEEILRVSVDKVDQLIALGEDMQVARIEMGQNVSDLQHLNEEVMALSEAMEPLKSLLRGELKHSDLTQLQESAVQLFDAAYAVKGHCRTLQASMHSSASDFSFVTSELNHSLFTLRLVSASTLLQGMTRSVRDIAREMGKQVDVQLIGDDIQMDRIVLNNLKAPLLHLIRNAIDHGIEYPDERAAKGKSETGTVTIMLSAAGSEVCLTVSDDGQGIDVDKVADAAVKKELIRSDEREVMDQTSLLDLIFHPGFSTRDIITDISGRGVGLDVVRSALANIKGRVSVETVLNEGTSFQLFLPRMLTSERGLLVKAGGDTYVIPTTSVDRVMTVQPDEIVKVDGNEAILIEGRAVPLRSLTHALGLNKVKSIEQDLALSLVIIRKGVAAVAFLVDEVMQEREIVVKSLMLPLTSLPHVMGAAVSASLGVMMVLNANALLDSALSGGSSISFKGKERRATASQRILLVDDSITTRTLEKSVLESRGYTTTLAVNGSQAWDILQNQHFDLIITDVEMPLMNGFELTTKIKGDATLKSTPVIIVTSLANDADKKRGVDAGADAYIVKSQFESKALLALVEQLI